MKAIVVHVQGGLENLKYEDVPDPAPGPGEVLVRIRAAGLNYADILLRTSGYFGIPLPAIPGSEAAGVVEAVGSGVQGYSPGDRVAGLIRRSYAELAVAPATSIFKLPEEMTFEQGAAIPVAFVTAWHALFDRARLKPGEWVLVHAAGSGVGSAAIQLARLAGGRVITTAGSEWKLEMAKRYGAEVAVDYRNADFAEAALRATNGKGVHIALESVGEATLPGTIKSMATHGRLVVFGAVSGGNGQLNIWDIISKQITIYGISMARSPETPKVLGELTADALPFFVNGQLKAAIFKTIPLENAAEAQQIIETRGQFGKVVLVP